MTAWLLLIFSYIIGSIPFSVLLGRICCGIDIREHGSGNPGTTNVFRVLGKRVGFTVFFLDMLKGGFVILLIRLGWFNDNHFHPLLYGMMAAIGHIYPVFLNFKGGKAVATSVGILLFYAPFLGLLGLFTFFAILAITRFVSLASCSGTLAAMIGSYVVFFIGPLETSMGSYIFGVQGDIIMIIITTFGSSMIVYRHRGNFINIAKGIEPKAFFLRKRPKKDS